VSEALAPRAATQASGAFPSIWEALRVWLKVPTLSFGDSQLDDVVRDSHGLPRTAPVRLEDCRSDASLHASADLAALALAAAILAIRGRPRPRSPHRLQRPQSALPADGSLALGVR